MLHSPQHTSSHRNSSRFTGNQSQRTSSPASVPSNNLYSIAQSFGPDPDSIVASPSRSSMFAVPRSMESSIDRVADLPTGDLSELLYQNRPWWRKDISLSKEATSRSSHQRESSLTSTLGSTGPNSPCSPNISTPQIAVTDSMDDAFRDGHTSSPWNYHFTPDSMPLPQDQYLYTGPQLYGLPMNNSSTKLPYSMNTYAGNQQSAPQKPLDAPTNQPRALPEGTLSGPNAQNEGGPLHSPAYLAPNDQMGRRRSKKPEATNTDFTTSFANLPASDYLVMMPDVPKLDRTMTDVYNDGLYSPNLDIISTASSSSNPNPQTSPESDIFSQRLNAAGSLAHSMRDGNGATDFHQTPRHALTHHHGDSPLEDDRLLLRNSEVNTPQTISPRDSMLDFSEADGGANFPLFARPESSRFGGMEHLTDEEASLRQCENVRPQYSVMDDEAISTAQHYIPSSASNAYASHDLSPFGHPDVLPSAISFEGNGNTSASMGPPGLRPGHDDGGTYSCTYHGCMLRFDTPALLQKHKREGHRQAGGLKSAQRGIKGNVVDTQAGPHRCYRVNPGTGKVCKAVFSRPYDLTRHEDTIHNARKQKVRCDLCTEEKLFSRADALTRHYRVCHPDVELPGKHRRRRNVHAD